MSSIVFNGFHGKVEGSRVGKESIIGRVGEKVGSAVAATPAKGEYPTVAGGGVGVESCASGVVKV